MPLPEEENASALSFEAENRARSLEAQAQRLREMAQQGTGSSFKSIQARFEQRVQQQSVSATAKDCAVLLSQVQANERSKLRLLAKRKTLIEDHVASIRRSQNQLLQLEAKLPGFKNEPCYTEYQQNQQTADNALHALELSLLNDPPPKRNAIQKSILKIWRDYEACYRLLRQFLDSIAQQAPVHINVNAPNAQIQDSDHAKVVQAMIIKTDQGLKNVLEEIKKTGVLEAKIKEQDNALLEKASRIAALAKELKEEKQKAEDEERIRAEQASSPDLLHIQNQVVPMLQPNLDTPSMHSVAVAPSLEWAIHNRLFAQDLTTVRFAADRVLANETYKACLLRTIEQSKRDERYAIDAANAIAILHQAGVGLSEVNLQGIHLPVSTPQNKLLQDAEDKRCEAQYELERQRKAAVAKKSLALQDALIKACEEGDTAQVKTLLQQGADPAQAGSIGKQPLGAAVWGMNQEVVNTLLEEMKDKSPLTWEECKAHNLRYYKEVFMFTTFAPKTYGEWYALLIRMSRSPYLCALHLAEADKKWNDNDTSSWEKFVLFVGDVGGIGKIGEGSGAWIGGWLLFVFRQVALKEVCQNSQAAFVQYQQRVEDRVNHAVPAQKLIR